MNKKQIEDEFLSFQTTPEDRDLALKISSEYPVPFDDLWFLIEKVRSLLHFDLVSNKYYIKDCEFSYQYFNETLFSPDVKIKTITIKTNKGTIIIKPQDYIFDFFSSPIHKIKAFYENRLNPDGSFLCHRNIKFYCELILYYFDKKITLSKFQKCVIIGTFLVHFKFYRGKPLMTEQEFNLNPTDAAPDYKHYLYDIVKSWLKTYSGTLLK